MSVLACAWGSWGRLLRGAGELARVVRDDGVVGAATAAVGVATGVERRDRFDMVREVERGRVNQVPSRSRRGVFELGPTSYLGTSRALCLNSLSRPPDDTGLALNESMGPLLSIQRQNHDFPSRRRRDHVNHPPLLPPSLPSTPPASLSLPTPLTLPPTLSPSFSQPLTPIPLNSIFQTSSYA